MPPQVIVAAASAGLALIEALIPQMKELFQKGEITDAQQQELLTRFNSLKDQIDTHFQGPEWEK